MENKEEKTVFENERNFGEYFYVQLLGHKQFVGVVTLSETFEGMIKLQVLSKYDSMKFWYTKYVNINSIYDMTAIDKKTAERIAPEINTNPVDEWQFEDLVKDTLKKHFPDINLDKIDELPF